jgi:HAD superfamily hydrolase (TIGR01459 family)
MQLLTSIAPLRDTADVWFLDIWGVLHNGHKPFAGAVAACRTFREVGGRVILVSNSPRPRAGVIRQLDDIGVDRQAYDDAITSGDVSRALISAEAGALLLHIGPERDLPLFEGLAVSFASAETAGVAVCSGLFDDETETPADYAALLAKLKARNVHLICANPDIKAERAGRIIYCAGAIAEAYERIGGEVRYAGKPHPPIYVAAMDMASRLTGGGHDESRVLAIGDGVATDICGASRAGIRSVFVASGVHVARGVSLADAAETLFADEPDKPIGLMTALAW